MSQKTDGDIKVPNKVVVAGFISTFIEWYDFLVYGTVAALVFSQLFFPKLDAFAGTLAALSTFTVGFIARPLGGIVFEWVDEWWKDTRGDPTDRQNTEATIEMAMPDG